MRCNAPMLGRWSETARVGSRTFKVEAFVLRSQWLGNGRRHRSINHKRGKAWEGHAQHTTRPSGGRLSGMS